VIPDPPVPGALNFIEIATKHFDVQIYSSRSQQEGGIDAMKAWLVLKYGGSTVPIVKWPTEKPPAMVTIDDRAITFTGVWPTIKELKNFKPWNKK